MNYSYLKEHILQMFDESKLQALPGEWGFFHEPERKINRIAYAVNLTPETIRKASEENAELLLTHHDSWEFMYGLKEKCSKMLKEYNITHAFFHAPLDDADFGTSASLAQTLDAHNCRKAMPYMDIYYGGVIGEIQPTDFESFHNKLNSVLNEEVRTFQNNSTPIHKIAVAAGGGNMTSEIKIAHEQGCDTYITGEYALYSQQYAAFAEMNLFVGSHTNTEILGIKNMAQLISKDTNIQAIQITEPNY